MGKNKAYNLAKNLSLSVSFAVYVWETKFGEWDYSVNFPTQYYEISAKFKNGVNLYE